MEFSITMSRIISNAKEYLGIIIPIMAILLPMLYSTKQDKKFEKVRKASIGVLVLLAILSLIITILDINQTYHNEDVFKGQYIYVGQTLNQKAHGRGEKYDQKGNLIYKGEFKCNMYNGKGTYFFPPDDYGHEYRYEGEFADNMYNGKGKMYLNDHLIY